MRHYLPAFHEIIDRAVAAHQTRFGRLASTTSRRGSMPFGQTPRRSSALSTSSRRGGRRRHTSMGTSASATAGPAAGPEPAGAAAAAAAAPEAQQRSPGGDPDAGPRWTHASASLEISSAPYGRT